VTIINALTFDVEEYFQVTGFAGRVAPAHWDFYESRVGRSTADILDVLAAADRRATFFILGWVARRCPRLVRSIHEAGHEVAAHGYWHQLVTTQAPAQFRADVRAAKDVLEDLIGEPVTGYRAPSFSIAPGCAWAFEVLAEEGYRIDSSVAAGRRTACGHLAPDGCPFLLKTASGTLQEYPLPTVRWLGRPVPVGGGGYFRLFPYAVTHRALHGLNAAGRPFAVYLHPWEFDPGQPRLRLPLTKAFRHYVNLRRTRPRLERLLADFRFDTLSASLEAYFAARKTVTPLPLRPPAPAAASAPAGGRSRRTTRRAAA
jgi:polysaccharide deacetylase family protein (PEP-CTERM system associated)